MLLLIMKLYEITSDSILISSLLFFCISSIVTFNVDLSCKLLTEMCKQQKHLLVDLQLWKFFSECDIVKYENYQLLCYLLITQLQLYTLYCLFPFKYAICLLLIYSYTHCTILRTIKCADVLKEKMKSLLFSAERKSETCLSLKCSYFLFTNNAEFLPCSKKKISC